MQQQSPFSHHSPSVSDPHSPPLPHPHGISSSPSHDLPKLRNNTSEQSLNSELSGSDYDPTTQQQQARCGEDSDVVIAVSRADNGGGGGGGGEQRGRASSEVTVNNHLDSRHYQKTLLSQSQPSAGAAAGARAPASLERDSNLFEISEEEMNGGYLARSVIAPG
jgi:hypothetical protein